MLSAEERYRLLEEASELNGRWEYNEVLGLLSGIEDDALLAEPELAYLAALAAYRTGHRDRASALLEKIRLATSRLGKDRLYCRRVSLEGALYVEQGKLDAARNCFSEIIFIASVREYVPQITTAITNLGVIESIKCNWDESVVAFQRAIAAYENLGELYNLAGAHHNLAITYRELGTLDHAVTHCDKSWQIFQESNALKEVVYTLYERSLILLAAGDVTFAESTVRRGIAMLEIRGDQEEAEGLWVLGMVLKSKGDLQQAKTCFSRSLVLGTKTRATLLVARAHEELADLQYASDQKSEAHQHLSVATDLYEQMGAEKRARRAMARLGG